MLVTENIKYVGVNDHHIDLFEGQYHVPHGMAYNSYVILDEKVAVMDTVDIHFTHEWLDNIAEALNGRQPDYLIIQHMEPDHSANILNFMKVYPQTTLVGNAKTFMMMEQFFPLDENYQRLVVKNGEELCLGEHTLSFVFAPMVHWPEVMMTYDQKDHVLFSADGFGKFGAIEAKEDWDCEARRYYFGIVGKYGMQVQALLNKVSNLEIKMICPLHGPILKENLKYYIDKYKIWSSYEPEDEGIYIACASIHGNTLKAGKKMEEICKSYGNKKVVLADLTKTDWAEAVEDAFRYSNLIVMASSYNAGLFPPMKQFLEHLKERNYQKRTVAIIENGSWAPSAGRCMKQIIEEMKDIKIIEPIITIKSTMDEENMEQMKELANTMSK